MYKEYPPRTTTNRSQEEDGLRELVKRLEEEARYQHGAEAERTEQRILAAEDKLRATESTRPRTASVLEPVPEASINSSKTETEGERAERMNRLRKLEILRAAQASRKEPPAPEPTFFDETPIRPEAPEDPVVTAKAARIAQERKEKREDNQARQFALRADVDRENSRVVGARAAYLRAHRMNMGESLIQQRKREYDEALAAFATKISQSAERRLDGERFVREGTEFEASDRKINALRTLDAKRRAKLDQNVTETNAFVSMKEDLPASKEMEDAEAEVTGLNARFAKVEAAQDPYRREKVLERYGRQMAFRENVRLNDRLHAAKERIRAEAEALDKEGWDVFESARILWSRINQKMRSDKKPIALRPAHVLAFTLALFSTGNTSLETANLSNPGDFLAEGAVMGQKLSQEHVVAPAPTQSAPEAAQTNLAKPEAKAESGAARGGAAVRNMYQHAVDGTKEAREPKVEVKAHRGEGADALFADLQQKLRKLYPDPMKAPEEVRHLLGEKPDAFSIEHGFEKGQQSAVIYEGDTLTLSKDGVLKFKNHIGSIVLEAPNASGHIEKGSTFDKMGGHYKQGFHFTSTEQETPAPVKAAPVEAPVQKAAPIATSAATAPAPEVPPAPSVKAAPEATPVQRPVEGTDWTSEEKKETAHLEKTPTAGGADVGGHDYEWDGEEEHTVPEEASIAPAPVESAYEIGSVPHLAHELLQPEALGQYADTSISKVLYDTPTVSPELRQQLVEVVMRSGIGPDDTGNETLAQFLARATRDAGKQGETRLRKDNAGRLVAFGGNQLARHFVAYEYLLKHPKERILYERGDGTASGVMILGVHPSPMAPANKQPFQSFTPLRDSSGNVQQHIDPKTLGPVVQLQ